MAQERFSSPSACDLLICDEAHRLKNDETLTNKVSCLRTAVASGVPDKTAALCAGAGLAHMPPPRAALWHADPGAYFGKLTPLSEADDAGATPQNHLDEFYAMVNFANPVSADLLLICGRAPR